MHIKYIEEFIEASIQRESAIEKGNARVANKNYDRQMEIVEDWRNNSDVDMKTLEVYLEHENDSVKLDIAFILLPVLPEKAEEVLEKLSLKKGSPARFDAEMTLREWRKGHLKF